LESDAQDLKLDVSRPDVTEGVFSVFARYSRDGASDDEDARFAEWLAALLRDDATCDRALGTQAPRCGQQR
jgi:hypothetical protein